ncbi:MAG: tRNA 4-thiouridine(8) synthase ThiI [Clostridia bacterium]|nr:tRNA 4-thiouridine(8) synthase ThiI [Clostridia bacterium]MBR3956116.1 tRNA 4-thiouridine(8) synthase ThiI [Clostridia bacterium]
MKEIILIKNGELALKGLNRGTFEDMMIKNMRHRLSSLGNFTFTKSQSTITVTPEDESVDRDEAVRRLSKVFGIAALSRAAVCEKDIDVIRNTAVEYLGDALSAVRTFKVEAKRSDKKFPLTSPQICEEVGGWLLAHVPGLRVDVHNPDITVTVEVRDKQAFIRGNQLHGAGGMPVGSGGNACLLISGGIDSPVAGWMMAKRGVRLTGVHFASPPYTSELAERKVHELLEKVTEYAGRIRLFTVEFTEIQEAIRDNCPEEMFTITMRRFMMKIASAIAIRENCGALITGESLGQVASQTLHALGCTDECASIPVFRPCIGMDKNEIVEISRKIDTFEISIRPYEDCCTVFTPKHPRTRATVDMARQAEEMIENREELMQRAIDSAVLKIIG